MKNIFISNLHEKDVKHCTTDIGLALRRNTDKPFKKLCNAFTNAHIIRMNNDPSLTDEEYFSSLSTDYIPLDHYDVKKGKNNIIVERYPELNADEPYIFVCNHTCPEDIETVLNVLDRNAYLILGSIESLQYNKEMYLLFLNGMIPFDIMDKSQRKLVFQKMLRVIKTNSILIFPEGSHNYSPNKLVNNLFDGPVNLALQTNRKIVVVTLVKDQEHGVSYMDVGNPIDVKSMGVDLNPDLVAEEEIEKYYVKSLSSQIRDRMATAVYHIVSRHMELVQRRDYANAEEYLRMRKIEDAFRKLKWDKDVFEAEYLTKKTNEELECEDVTKTLSNLTLNSNAVRGFCQREWILSKLDIDNKDAVKRMRQYWMETQKDQKVLEKKKK